MVSSDPEVSLTSLTENRSLVIADTAATKVNQSHENFRRQQQQQLAETTPKQNFHFHSQAEKNSGTSYRDGHRTATEAPEKKFGSTGPKTEEDDQPANPIFAAARCALLLMRARATSKSKSCKRARFRKKN